MCDLIITDTAVLFPDGTIRDGQTVEVCGGVITRVSKTDEKDRAAEAAARLPGKGRLLMPRLAD